jgi:hypothetical protein
MTFSRLERIQAINEGKCDQYRDYFRAKRTPRNTSIMLPPEHRAFYFTSVAFCRLACQVLSERIELDSIKTVDGNEDADKFLADTFKANGGSDFVNQAHMSAMEYGRAYLIPTGSIRTDGLPVLQLVTAPHMVHHVDPYSGEIDEALRVWGPDRTKRVYYTREKTVYLIASGDGWTLDPGMEQNPVPNPDGRIAVYPLICRGEADTTFGRPEAKDVFTLQDSGCRVASDLAFASGTMAAPLRVLHGVEEEDFTVRNPDGTVQLDTTTGEPKKQTGDQIYTAHLLTLSDPMSKISEYAAAQLQNFATALNVITRQTAALMGVPQSVFGVASDANPASGDGQRQDDSRLVRRAEQLTRGFEPAWSGVYEDLLRRNGHGDLKVLIQWMNPALPNLAALADSVLKLATVRVVQDGKEVPLYTWEELRRKLGDPQPEIDKAKEQLENQAITALLTQPPVTPPSPTANPPAPA